MSSLGSEDITGSSNPSSTHTAPILDRHNREPVREEAACLQADLTLAALLANHRLSARLDSMLRTTRLGTFTLGEFLRDRDG